MEINKIRASKHPSLQDTLKSMNIIKIGLSLPIVPLLVRSEASSLQDQFFKHQICRNQVHTLS